MVVGVTEFILDRPVRTVLDVGCGEGRWQPVLKGLRPHARYLGLDSSEYAVRRYGRHRNLRRCTFEDLAGERFTHAFDLVVCSDVLHYLSLRQIEAGLEPLARLVGGVAFLETFAREDDLEGDEVDFHRRPASAYRDLFRDVGLWPCGMQMYVHRDDLPDMVALELL